jgi:hypothetical protein
VSRIWAQTLGQVAQRTNSRTFTSLGVTSQVDLGYEQDYFGGQMGVDFGVSGVGAASPSASPAAISTRT